jgi:hypothetical protein
MNACDVDAYDFAAHAIPATTHENYDPPQGKTRERDRAFEHSQGRFATSCLSSS